MAKPSNLVQLSFADREPGSPEQISRVRTCLHRACVDRHGEDDILGRLSDGDDAEAALELSAREDFGPSERDAWLWVSASLGNQEAIALIGIVAQVRALTASEQRARSMRRTSDLWVSLGRSLADDADSSPGDAMAELDGIIAAGLEGDSFPVHPAANLFMD